MQENLETLSKWKKIQYFLTYIENWKALNWKYRWLQHELQH